MPMPAMTRARASRARVRDRSGAPPRQPPRIMRAVRRRLGEAAASWGSRSSRPAAACARSTGRGRLSAPDDGRGRAAVEIAAAPRRIACLAAPACATLAALARQGDRDDRRRPGGGGARPRRRARSTPTSPRCTPLRRGRRSSATAGSTSQAAGGQIARLGLAAGAGARGVALARQVDAGVRAALTSARRGRARRVPREHRRPRRRGPGDGRRSARRARGRPERRAAPSSLTFTALTAAKPEVCSSRRGTAPTSRRCVRTPSRATSRRSAPAGSSASTAVPRAVADAPNGARRARGAPAAPS